MSKIGVEPWSAPEEHATDTKPCNTGCDGSDNESSPSQASITSNMSRHNSVKASKHTFEDDCTCVPKPEVLDSLKTETAVTTQEPVSPSETPITFESSTATSGSHGTPETPINLEVATDIPASIKVEALADAGATSLTNTVGDSAVAEQTLNFRSSSSRSSLSTRQDRERVEHLLGAVDRRQCQRQPWRWRQVVDWW